MRHFMYRLYRLLINSYYYFITYYTPQVRKKYAYRPSQISSSFFPETNLRYILLFERRKKEKIIQSVEGAPPLISVKSKTFIVNQEQTSRRVCTYILITIFPVFTLEQPLGNVCPWWKKSNFIRSEKFRSQISPMNIQTREYKFGKFQIAV